MNRKYYYVLDIKIIFIEIKLYLLKDKKNTSKINLF